MNTDSIMIVEDESLIAHDIASSVSSLGFRVHAIFSNGIDAINHMKNGKIPSLILMDINLNSQLDGIETAKKIKQLHRIPIIYLTAYSDKRTIEKAIKTHPDNYITKPFNIAQLQATFKIVLQQQKEMINRGDIIIDDTLSFDTKGMQLIKNSEFVNLTKKETELLMLLIHRKNQIVPFDAIEIELWPDKEPNENTIRALISRLRSKLDNKHIETIVGMGYRLKLPR